MAKVSTKVSTRIRSALKRLQPILASAKSRDVNESDTVTVVVELLTEIFGYDKFTEVTSEHAIKSTYCDLAIKLDGELVMLIEVKAIGSELKPAYVKQAIDYAANQGVDWVILTNGESWHVFKLTFARPIDAELVTRVNISECDSKNEEHIEQLWMLSKEGWTRSALADHHARCQAFNRFTLGAVVTSDTVIDCIRREMRKLNSGVKVLNDEIKTMLLHEVVKRDVVEGEKADMARKAVLKAARKAARLSASNSSSPATSASNLTPTAVEPQDDVTDEQDEVADEKPVLIRIDSDDSQDSIVVA